MNDMLKDPLILRQIIMDHYEYPRHHSLIEDNAYHQVHMASESCIDDIYVQTKIQDGILQDIRFEGVACTISTASTSIMTELLTGKTLIEAQKIIEAYLRMIDGEPYDESLLDEAVAFSNIYKQPNRIKCATIGWKAIAELIETSDKHE
ncbi:MAG: SUF system NifU family Fe-S cluster assembly protein [Erysipelotrichaceae bacterium]|nr:SUF system NifU family Fe-S cluster assembly protein [Erysipelotrichaceae bacterium]